MHAGSEAHLNLDKLEAIARAAQESFKGDENVCWYNGGWDEECVSPDVVLGLIARIRELEAKNDALRWMRGML